MRASGGDRKGKLRLLYLGVKEFFEEMRLHGKYIAPTDLEEFLQYTMQRYLDEANKDGVAEAIAGTKAASRSGLS